MKNSIINLSAKDIRNGIENKEFSVVEVMKDHLKQIHLVNDKVNAIVNLNEEIALKHAKILDNHKDNNRGSLFGLPIAIKDTHNASGFITSRGSKIFKDNLTSEDDIITERLKRAGAIVIGKTNVPEFAAGSHTFNELYGTTKNPYNLSKSAGGSSGGAAAALATRMIPIADGSDMGGSCRNPASYNNVVGFRPSPSVVPVKDKKLLYSPLGVQGPLARNVEDIVLILSAISGIHEKAPLSQNMNWTNLDVKMDIKELKIGYSLDLGGAFPVDSDVKRAFCKTLKIFEEMGCNLTEVKPNFKDGSNAFNILRAYEYMINLGELYNKKGAEMKEAVRWNIDQGFQLNVKDIMYAEGIRNRIYNEMLTLFKRFDFILMPVSQVQPFDISDEYPKFVKGKKMNNYIEWMESSSLITLTGCPAISIPAGFCENGLPIGIQIVAPLNQDKRLLQFSSNFERVTKYSDVLPTI